MDGQTDMECMSDSDESGSHNANPQWSFSCFHNPPPPDNGDPYLEILEQPQSRGFRFRYECEGKSHGGLQGENSRREKKSYPAIRICHYQGPAKITVSLVTDEKEPKPHAHELIGKNCANGTCTVSIKGDNMSVSFPNLGIRHVTKRSVTKILTDRLRESLKADKMMDGELGQDADQIPLSQMEEMEIRKQAENQAKNMPLSVVRLSFRAYLLDANALCTRVLRPVISNPIYDSKAPCAALLKICRMDKVGGCCIGNEEVFLLCDKVQKDDIAIRFYELDDEGNVKWEDYGNFAAHDVHRQYAIVFRTPAYVDSNIDRPVTVHVQLRRFSDGEVSDPKTFTYYPQQTDLEDIQKKRKKQIPNFSDGDGFNVNNNAGLFNVASILQTGFNGFADLGSLNGRATIVSRLEEDSIASDGLGSDLVSRGAEPSTKCQFLQQQPTVLQSAVKDHEPNDCFLQDTDDMNKTSHCNKEKQFANQEWQLMKLLHCLAHRTAKSIQRYAQTGDSRHLLLPARHLISSQNDDGDNAIHLSVIHRSQTSAASLLSVLSTLPNPSALNDLNDVLQSPLQLAVLTQQPGLVKLLLSYGADPRCTYDYKSGDTLLHTCARRGDDGCLGSILQYWSCSGISEDSNKWHPGIDEMNYEGFTALHLAVRGNHLTCVKLLLTVGGADVNAPDGCHGRTALHHAVNTNNLAIVGYLLLECSVDTDKPDDTGNTPLHYAAATNKLGVAALLVAASADADCENIELDMSDCDSDNEFVVEDGNVQRDDGCGKTARDLAFGNPKMLRILNGEPYSSVSHRLKDHEKDQFVSTGMRLKSFFDSGIESINTCDLIQKHILSDVNKLDAVIRMKLSKLLDPTKNGADWRELAIRLGFHPMAKVFEMQKNPTLAVLDNLELANGSVADLRKNLSEMNRKDAVRLIDEALQPFSPFNTEL